MDTLLKEMQQYLITNMIQVNPVLIRTVHIMNDAEMDFLLTDNDFPCVVITPIGERHEPGPFANTGREIFSIRLRILVRSSMQAAYYIQAISGAGNSTVTNIFALSKKIRQLLYQDKKLTNNIFEMQSRFEIQDITMLGADSSINPGRDIYIEYTELEAYTGMQNNQADLVTPTSL